MNLPLGKQLRRTLRRWCDTSQELHLERPIQLPGPGYAPVMHRWWDGDASEHYWLEVTDRPDIGADLNAPQFDDSGRRRWSYDLMSEAEDGDVVYHYSKHEKAIIGHSIIRGLPWEDLIVWGAKGTSAREHNVQPYIRPGYRRALQHFTNLAPPVGLARVQDMEERVLGLRASLEEQFGEPVYFPFNPHGNDGLRPTQGYCLKFPAELVGLLGLPEVEPIPEVLDAAGTPPPPSSSAQSQPTGGVDYREADEDVAVSTAEPMQPDPALVERALASHRRTQNALAKELRSRGLAPLSPATGDRDWDIAWIAGDTFYVCEVKSLSDTNEERQLRLALGQVSRYRQAAATSHPNVVAVIATAREPRDGTWSKLLADLDILLVWPSAWDRLWGGSSPSHMAPISPSTLR